MTNTMNLHMRLRVLHHDEIAFGPGKADLLDAIQRTGSISQAAKSMQMSYRRAWQLVDTMNRSFQSALVDTQTGGSHGGGAYVTELGQSILRAFRQMEQQAKQAAQPELLFIQQQLKQSR